MVKTMSLLPHDEANGSGEAVSRARALAASWVSGGWTSHSGASGRSRYTPVDVECLPSREETGWKWRHTSWGPSKSLWRDYSVMLQFPWQPGDCRLTFAPGNGLQHLDASVKLLFAARGNSANREKAAHS